ncbi:class I SAM-dependent methyltransferase [Ancylomarina euxinus]|uniref:Class I SAM-dependent methyltransferase n=1 Tax=Ancylomarina euxinus TaxID=2283627 RepID=A0A425XWW0_9BACT|nr:class I SAM-dependent methyltransferase [Ancylomarina euxinus]MCZ4696273.1 class I SAM-dependent methyltransferase [Ancylomarina euxinus]MUP16697.1 methyltransferase domain-containing protein [Ancylomarina euxinus]RRG19130.1 class I SAM-dependent methyltransferase [Ancylomarina euxinus]
MDKSQSEMWDERYSSESFVYGIDPNLFFKEELQKLSVGRLLLPAEGEGRNAVFAASQSWQVSAFDLSKEGRLKALELARKNQVDIDYELAGFEDFSFEKESFDCIALIYAHVPENKRKDYHQLITKYLKPGGVLILEGFSKEQLGKKSGGPGQVGMLFSKENLLDDFSELKTVKLQELDVELSEGEFHQGVASVIRYVGKK